MKALLPIVMVLMLTAPAVTALAQAPPAHGGDGWQLAAAPAIQVAQTSRYWSEMAQEEVVAGSGLEVAVFPNPVTSAAVVRFQLESSQHLVLDVFDLLGRRVLQQDLGLVTLGEHEAGLDLRRLPTGLYIVRLTGDAGARATVRVTKATSA